MANVTAGVVPIVFEDPFDISNLWQSFLGARNSTSFTTSNSLGHVWQFTGVGLTYSASGPISGTITGLKFISDGLTIFHVTGISMPVPQFMVMLNSLDLSGMLQAMFSGSDTMTGNDEGDYLNGYAGNDILNSNGGDDIIATGTGVDTVDGGAGSDELRLDRSNISLGLSIDLDAMATSTGVTLADGSIIRNIEKFKLVTGSGNDAFVYTLTDPIAPREANTINGGAGVDRLTADMSAATAAISDYLTWSNVEEVWVTGSAGNDTITGGSGNDRLIGGGGNDTLSAGSGGVDLIDGGDGIDRLFFDRSTSTTAVVADLSAIATTGGVTLPDGTVISNIEIYGFSFGSGDDQITFNVSGNFTSDTRSFNGGDGVDRFTADFSGMTDRIDNQVTWQNFEEVHVTGGSGNDQIVGGNGNDVLNGGDGNDALHGYNGIWGSAGVDIFDGGAGVDEAHIYLREITTPLTIALSAFAAPGGTTFANGTVVRNVENIKVYTGSGDDTFDIGAGSNSSSSPRHLFHGGSGLDTITGNFAAAPGGVVANGGGVQWWGGGEIGAIDVERYVITGSAFDDYLRGTVIGDDVFSGGAGADALYLDGGSDVLDGGDGIDILHYRLGSLLAQDQTINAAAFAAMATGAGYTFVNGAVARNIEKMDIVLGLGNDTVNLGSFVSAVERIDGNTGLDALQIDFSGETRNVSVANGAVMFSDGSLSFRFYNLERLLLIGSVGQDYFVGLDGDDALNGAEGNDNLQGGLGADILDGGDGNDSIAGYQLYYGSPSNDGADILRGGAGDDRLYGSPGGDMLDGGSGNDTVIYEGASVGLVASLVAPHTNTGEAAGDTFISIENLYGTRFNDVLTGDSGANLIAGLSGNDTINGGGGVDTVLLGGLSSQVSWVRNINGAWTVKHLEEGLFGVFTEWTDTLSSVEMLVLGDRNVALDNAQQTFFGNGTSDLLLRNSSHGTVVIWDVTGGVQNSATVAGGAPNDWQIIGTGDLNGDGRDDLIWRHDAGGVAGWLMNGASATSIAMVGGAPNEWQVAGIGDFNFDGKDDFIWRNSNDGSVAVWLMNGLAPSSQSIISGAPVAWGIAAIADFDGDGRDDILLRHSDGTVARWTTDGVTQTSATIVGFVPTEWSFAGAGDFDGDGRADMLWRNASDGALAMWRMDGSTQLGAAMIGAAPNAWEVSQIGDFTGDGKDDILWRHDDGTLALWAMNGFAVANVSIIPGIPTEWDLI